MPSTAPTPSTWPWTMWTPRRESGFSGSMGTTRDPGASMLSEERRSVSYMTSAPNSSPPHTPVAVRQTPLTATLSPSESSRASGDVIAIRTPSFVASTEVTVPRSSTSPVNTSPLPQPGADQQVVGDLVAVQGERAQRLGDLLDAFPLQRVARLAPADHQGREEEADLVDLAGVEERAGKVRAALEQDRGHALVAERRQRAAHPRGLVLAGGDNDVGAGRLERLDLRAVRRARDDDGERHLGRLRDELGVQRQPRGRVEHDAPRLAMHALHTGGELGVVSERGADADGDRVDRGAPAVGELARGVPGDPLRVAGRRRHLAVERHGGLEQHPRPSRAGVLAKRLVGQPRAVGQLTAGDIHLDALVAKDAQPPAGRLLARGGACDHDPSETGFDDRVRAGRLLARVTAGLQRDVQRRAAQVGSAGRRDRGALGVQAAELGMPALAQQLAVANDHSADDGIRMHATDPVGGKVYGPGEMLVGGFEAKHDGLAYARAESAPQAVDGHHRARAPVRQRVVVERPVEVERHRSVPRPVRRELRNLVGPALELVVVGDRPGHHARLGLRPPALRRAADDVAVALALIEVDQARLQLALVVLDVDDLARAELDRSVVRDVRAAGRELRPAVAVGR